MSTIAPTQKALKGGEWLIKECLPAETFIPEEFSEEQKMIRELCNQFLDTEINPILDRIDSLEPGLMASLVTKTGELGLLSTSIPEETIVTGKQIGRAHV